MTFSLDSLKESIAKMDTLIQKENRIWIEELKLPEWFDSHTHYVYLPMHMKDMFKDQIFPNFIKFHESVPFDHMHISQKYLYTDYWSAK